MDLPIVLSHKTAWLYHNVARPSEPLSRASSLYDEDSLASEAEPTADLPKLGLDAKGLRASTAVGIVADYLVALGIPREELDHIDTLVNFDFERSTPAGFRCHVFGAPVPPGHLIEVAEGLLVVDEAMCFVQAGSWMSEPEQLEYGYEICARYHLNHLSTGDYIEMPQFAHQLQLHRAMNAIALAMGLKCDRSEAFQKQQNDLREFVIRHWDGGL